MTPQDLREMIGRMAPWPWFHGTKDVEQHTGNVYDGRGRYVCGCTNGSGGPGDATAIATLRNLAPALVELWEAVEDYEAALRAHGYSSSSAYDALPGNRAVASAHSAMLAAAERVGG